MRSADQDECVYRGSIVVDKFGRDLAALGVSRDYPVVRRSGASREIPRTANRLSPKGLKRREASRWPGSRTARISGEWAIGATPPPWKNRNPIGSLVSAGTNSVVSSVPTTAARASLRSVLAPSRHSEAGAREFGRAAVGDAGKGGCQWASRTAHFRWHRDRRAAPERPRREATRPVTPAGTGGLLSSA